MKRGFIDFEFNQEKNISPEIISIGCVVVDDDSNRELGRFYSIVRPKVNRTLAPFISKLTGISQEEIDEADDFITVSHRFKTFMDAFPKIKFYCWGNVDNKVVASTSNVNETLEFKNIVGTIENAQENISKDIKYDGKCISRNISLSKIRDIYGLEKREEHNALSDALTLADVFIAHKEKGQCNYSSEQETETSAIVGEMYKKAVESKNYCYPSQEEQYESLLKYSDNKEYVEVLLNRSLYDTAKKNFNGNYKFLKKEFDVQTIESEDFDKFSISVRLNDEEKTAVISIFDDGKCASIIVEIGKKTRKRVKRILQKMKEATE